MFETVERYYRILDLEPGASPEEVHQGYIDLTWVWHPDRFAGHPRLQQKAHCKLQQINEAHERLNSLQATLSTRNFRTQSKSQVPTPPQAPSPTDSLYQPRGNQTKGVNGKKTVKSGKSRSGCRMDEWLD